MNVFARELGPSYVPAFAARLVLGAAHGIARAPEALRQALREEDAAGMWTLALVLVQWYADALPPAEAKTVTEVLQPLALAPLAAQLTLVRERLFPYVRTAHQAQGEAQLAAAGVYFVAAVEQIGLGLLSAVLQAAPMRAVQEGALARVPLPAEVKAAYYDQARGGEAKGRSATAGPAGSPRASRAERFDRSDFVPRAHAQPAPARPTLLPLPLPTPQLAAEDVARAYLHTLGWDADAVERWLTGPNGPKPA